jgi:hypothetical protein
VDNVVYGLYQLVQLGLVLKCGAVVVVAQVRAVANKDGQVVRDHTLEKQCVQQTWAAVNIQYAQAAQLQ